MADLKISELNALAGSNLVAADELAIVDDSASETKKITVSDLITNGVTVISDDSIPGAKILFAAGDIPTASLANSAVTTEKLNDSAVTAAKLGNESTVDLLTTLPSAGAFTGQLAFDTDDNKLYLYDGSSWQSLKAAGSVNTVAGSTTGEINIVSTVSGDTATLSATIDNTTSAAQFLAGPTGSGGVVGYRTVVGSDLPTATTSAKGGVVVNGNGLIMDGDTIEINNAVTSSGTHHVVTYDANGLITGGRTLVSSDLPIATASARGAVIPGDGLTVDVSGNLSVNNTVAADTYTKVTVTAQGLVSAGTTLLASDIPDHSAAKLTSGTIPTSILANSAVTGVKLADQATTKFGGALGSDNVTIFPSGDYKGQFFYDETTADLYIYTGSAYVPITLLTGNLVNAGVYNANTNLLSTVTTAGSSAGFTAGAALPAPTGTNLNHYVVVSVSGTGSGAAPAVALAPPDMLLSQGVGAEYSLIDVSNAIAGQTASNISVVAAGNIIATNVQSALQELDTEKLQLAGGTMTGDLNLGTGVDVVFEGSAADDYETTLAVTNPTADRTITLPNVTGTVVTTGDTGTVTSTMLLDGTIVNADINASAEIAVSKLANGTARQLLQTDAGGSGVEFTSNVDVPGTLDVTGAVTLDSTLATTGLISANGKISFPLGTAAAPSIYFGSDTNTGVFSPAGDQVAITTAGTQRVTVDSSGNVGLGVASPANNLDIAIDTNNEGIRISSSTNVFGKIDFHANRSGADAGLGILDFNWNNTQVARIIGSTGADTTNKDDGVLQFHTAAAGSASEAMRVDSSGKVGIGTTSVTNKFEVSSGVDNSAVSPKDDTNGITITNSSTTVDTYAGMFLQSYGTDGVYLRAIAKGNNDIDFDLGTQSSGQSSGTSRLYIDSSGNVGISNTNPQYALVVGSGTDDTLSVDTLSAGSGVVLRSFDDGKTDYEPFGIAAQYINFYTKTTVNSSAERMRLDSSGNLIVGGTSVSSTNAAYITPNGTYVSNRTAGTNDLWNGKLNGTVTSTINADGSINAVGRMDAGSSSLNNAAFVGLGNHATKGVFQAYHYSSGAVFVGGGADGVTKVQIDANGTALFSGIVRNAAGAYIGTETNTKRLDDSSNGSSSATLFIGNASIQVSSDARLKENIEATSLDAISAIKKINVKDFTWNDPSDTSFNNRNARGKWTGLIAQELVEILPFIVNAPRKESDGSIDHDSEETWTLDQSQLCPVLIKAMQQQQEIISALEQRLTDAGL